MGQLLEDDTIITGNACTACEGILWDVGQTPKQVYVHFTQLQRCPGIDWSLRPLPPNNRVFTLTQDAGIPCKWYFGPVGDFDVLWYLRWGPLFQTKFALGFAPLNIYFQHNSPPNWSCIGSAVNQNVCGGLIVAAGGFVWVEWKQIAIDQAKKLSITLAPTLFYEVFQINVRDVVYKFTDKVRGINLKLKLEM